MKILISTLLLLTTSLLYAHNFNYKFDDIKRQAKNVWEEQDVSNAESDASSLVDEIEKHLRDEDDLTVDEKAELKKLIKDVEDVEKFIIYVISGRSYSINIDGFNNAVSILGASTTIINSNYKVKFVKVELNGLVVLMAYNTNKTVGYEMVIKSSSLGGSSTTTNTCIVEKYSYRQLSDNRDNRSLKTWKIISAQLKEWSFGF